ncbi:MAG: hypothetical protein PHR25_01910 [Clostridia bacterium]|nr:hypothetical protein [Clostridia bacterium]MDD4375514.1 hypothetical protein [Clostridia bacterium]
MLKTSIKGTMKFTKGRGISLIVLVITIIVMMILAGAIMLSLTNNGIISNAKEAKESSNLANIKHAVSLLESEYQLDVQTGKDVLQGKTKEQYFEDKLKSQGIDISKCVLINENDNIIVERLGIKEIIQSGEYTFLLLNNNSLIVWGSNHQFQLGLGDSTFRTLPTLIHEVENVKKVATGNNAVLALLNDGTVKAWGNNSTGGTLGLGTTSYIKIPTQVPELINVRDVIIENGASYAILNDGTVKACGNNSNGQLGLGDTTRRYTPIQIPNLINVRELITSFSCYAILNDGTVKSWGSNGNGRLGLGDTTARYTPTPIPSENLSNVKEIIYNGGSIFAILNDGTVKSWGYNYYGQLGLGDTTAKHTPIQIPNLTNVKKIENYSNSLFIALLNDGTVKSWGTNNYGSLGLGDTTARYTPTIIPDLINVRDLMVQNSASYATLNDGTVKVWGNNAYGQLGLGDITARYTPIQIPNLTNVKQIIKSSSYTSSVVFAILNDGTVKSWGRNNYGQLALGDTTDRYTPTQIEMESLLNIKQIINSQNNSYVLLNDRKLKVWGYNVNGRLGLGDKENRTSPTLVNLDNFFN